MHLIGIEFGEILHRQVVLLEKQHVKITATKAKAKRQQQYSRIQMRWTCFFSCSPVGRFSGGEATLSGSSGFDSFKIAASFSGTEDSAYGTKHQNFKLHAVALINQTICFWMETCMYLKVNHGLCFVVYIKADKHELLHQQTMVVCSSHSDR